jgi:outer membrane protein assembly factor BamB
VSTPSPFRLQYLALLLLLSAAAPAQATWPQYRGPGGTGIAQASDNPPVEFGPSKHVLWKTAIPSGHSSPSIWGDRIFLTSFDKSSNKLEVLAIDRANGKILWRRDVPAKEFEEIHSINSLATATPVVDGERVYAYFGSYGIICFDFDGNLKWTVPLPVAHIVPHGSGASLLLAGDRVILNRDEVPDTYLLAVDRHTGKTIWKQRQNGGPPEKRNGSKATPVLWKDEIVLHRRGEIVGYDVATGERKWWVKVETQGAGTPVASADAIFVGTWFNAGEPDLRIPLPDFDALLKQYDKNGDGALDAQEFPERVNMTKRVGLEGVEGADSSRPGPAVFRAADKDKDGKITRSEWEEYANTSTSTQQEHGLLAIRPGGQGDVTASRVLWKETRAVPEVPTPLYYDSRVYTVTNGGIVSCIDASSGKVLFRGRLGADGAYFASPIEAAGRIYFASGEGTIAVIRAGDRLEVLAKNEFDEPLYATPAVIGRAIYVRTPTFLYAFSN